MPGKVTSSQRSVVFKQRIAQGEKVNIHQTPIQGRFSAFPLSLGFTEMRLATAWRELTRWLRRSRRVDVAAGLQKKARRLPGAVGPHPNPTQEPE